MRFFLAINGILSNPQGVDDWQDRFCAYINRLDTNDKADRYEYLCGALTRRIGQGRRVADCHKLLITAKPAARKVVVAHSNGCDILLRMVAQYPWLRVHELYLVAAAAEHDFRKNGLNDAVQRQQVERIVCYCSPQDKALKAAKRSRDWLWWLGLGYGCLGLIGPQNMTREAEAKTEVVWRPYAHSEWFNEGERFEELMERIV